MTLWNFEMSELLNYRILKYGTDKFRNYGFGICLYLQFWNFAKPSTSGIWLLQLLKVGMLKLPNFEIFEIHNTYVLFEPGDLKSWKLWHVCVCVIFEIVEFENEFGNLETLRFCKSWHVYFLQFKTFGTSLFKNFETLELWNFDF